MTDLLSIVPDIIKSGEATIVEIIKAVETAGNNETINGIATLMGISGFSLRDLIGKDQMKKIFYKIKNCFKDKKATEEQQEIIKDCFLELEDYIKNCEELDVNVFEKISEILINGIETENVLTREYIKILKKLSWVDLMVLIEMDITQYAGYADTKIIKEMKENYIKNFTYMNEKVPYELVEKSLEKLEKMDFINIKGRYEKDSKYIPLRSNLGDKIVNLIKGKVEE